jgi:hypothetical protein
MSEIAAFNTYLEIHGPLLQDGQVPSLRTADNAPTQRDTA